MKLTLSFLILIFVLIFAGVLHQSYHEVIFPIENKYQLEKKKSDSLQILLNNTRDSFRLSDFYQKNKTSSRVAMDFDHDLKIGKLSTIKH